MAEAVRIFRKPPVTALSRGVAAAPAREENA
jgi:hypothetical protein